MIQTLEGKLVQHDDVRLVFRFSFGSGPVTSTKAFKSGSPRACGESCTLVSNDSCMWSVHVVALQSGMMRSALRFLPN